jgi:2-C-methyl-D-erythritol 4-phosphate cytidylyltransferase
MSLSAATKPILNQGNLAAEQPRIWAVIPAAGVGARMASAAMPKQFLKIGEQTILERAVRALLADLRLVQIIVVVSPQDALSHVALEGLLAETDRLRVARCGGSTRAASVANGLAYCLAHAAHDGDWVLVHDAARPGLSKTALARLIDTVLTQAQGISSIGGLLALPVVDTVKRSNFEESQAQPKEVKSSIEPRGNEAQNNSSFKTVTSVQTTLSRDRLWLAQTPQMFRIGLLQTALSQFAEVTDEASAMEAAGYPVLLVEGERENFKITLPEDLHWAERLLIK